MLCSYLIVTSNPRPLKRQDKFWNNKLILFFVKLHHSNNKITWLKCDLSITVFFFCFSSFVSCVSRFVTFQFFKCQNDMSNEIPLFSNHFHFIQNAFLVNLIDFHCHNGKVNWQIMNYIWQKRYLFYKSSLTSKINGKINWEIVKHNWQKEKSKRKTLYLLKTLIILQNCSY
jgi:hypothetical protein